LLPLALDSVFAQTYDEFEVIVVDDGSTDETLAVLEKYAADHPRRFRYFAKPNGGCASARNFGLRQARGACVAFLDSDDWFLPRKLEAQVTALERTGAQVVFGPWYQYYEERETYLGPVYPVAYSRPADFARQHFLTTGFQFSCALVRLACFQSLEFDETMRLNEDSDLAQRIAIEWGHWAADAVPAFVLRIHPAGKSRDRVGIYENLIRSAQAIGREYAGFREALGPAYGERLAELNRRLASARFRQGCLSAAQSLREARRHSARRQLWLAWQVQALDLAGALATDRPLGVGNVLRAVARRIRAFLGAWAVRLLGEERKRAWSRRLRGPATTPNFSPEGVPGAPLGKRILTP
jgi:glycosyltransferase involved in cell wall biosynthesis